MMIPSALAGVDVGGTFTDVFVLDEVAGTATVAKVPSTPHNQAEGFLAGLEAGAGSLDRLATVVHGTTVGTNALLERKGGVTGIITTAGFRDVLEMRRRDRPRTWGLWGTFEPVVPRDRRLEVVERTLADGTIRAAIDPEDVKAAARTLIDRGCEAVAIVFINAYANDANERAALDAVRSVWPNEHVTASHAIVPEIREFERTSTATLNAYLQPTVGRYIGRLEAALQDRGSAAQVLIVQSNGGVMTVGTARQFPVRTTLSGPAAGVIAAAHIGDAAGYPNLVTCDMGGTSFDVSLVAGGQSALAAQTSIAFGMVIRSPMIEIITIGAGGGSIARVDAGGLLQVGPESAGSDPGPVCYGQGNDRPTVTDASLVLGRINADRPIGGKLDRLDLEAARRAVSAHVSEPLGLSSPEAGAEAIIHVANAKMAGAIRLVSIERGHDPKDFVAVPFGGGGALHAGALIRDVGLKKALVPRYPGVTSALGCTIADLRQDFVETWNTLLDSLDTDALSKAIQALSDRGTATVTGAGVALEGVATLVELDMLYVGQTHTVAAPLSVPAGGVVDRAGVQAAFEAAYVATFGRLLSGIAMRVMNLRVAVVGKRPRFDLALLAPSADATMEDARRGIRRVYVDGGWHETAIYDRLALPVDATIDGPAILEQSDTTILIEPGLVGTVDRFGNVLIGEKNG
ncbi:MAG: hydantoinase/oxoprolinase family protein [Alphaproteobacteria bacterium]|nr:hydantoinase/oxoprolinase family protein [Alphaproteobacteria bacterium]